MALEGDSTVTAKEANAHIHEVLNSAHFNAGYLDEYLQNCWQANRKDFHMVIDGLVEERDIAPLHVAVKRGLTDGVEILLKYNADLNVQSQDGYTPLMMACAAGSLSIVHLLVKHGADINIRYSDGKTCLHFCAENGASHVLHYLEVACNSINTRVKDNEYHTLLHYAVMGGHCQTVQYLTRKGRSEIHAGDRNGNTAMHLAISHGQENAAICLMKCVEEDLCLDKNKKGQSPIDIGMESKKSNLIGLAQRMLWLSSASMQYYYAWFCWLLYLLLPIAALGLTPFLYNYFSFPYGIILAVLVMANWFFRMLFGHRLTNRRFDWPNPALLGAQFGGYAHSFVCALVYFPLQWSSMCYWLYIVFPFTFYLFYHFGVLLWQDPGVDKVGRTNLDGSPMTIVDIASNSVDGDYCMTCEFVTRPRTKHCKLCGTCCEGFDHHCMWIMKCVGKGNHKRFVFFCFLLGVDNFFFVAAGMHYLSVIAASFSFYDILKVANQPDNIWLSFLIVCNLATGIYAFMNVYAQLENVSSLRTTYFDSQGNVSYNKRRSAYVSMATRLRNIKLFFLDYKEWYSYRTTNSVGPSCYPMAAV